MRAALLSLCLALLPLGGMAQQSFEVQVSPRADDSATLRVPVQVLTINRDRLFSDSKFGRQVQAEIDAAVTALNARNDEIAAELEAEEKSLTEQRADLEPEAFRVLADAFDEKAENIRRERIDAQRALLEREQAERRMFNEKIQPVIDQVLIESGALVILDETVVVRSLGSIDITDLVIRRFDSGISAPVKE
jgi:Skp family chaperone for outer membrane proteins